MIHRFLACSVVLMLSTPAMAVEQRSHEPMHILN